MSQQADERTATVAVRNLGGIDTCEVTFRPGVTVLAGRNATNRTSLLTAIGGVLGGTGPTLKSDADDGSVTLTLGGSEYTRRYVRHDGQVRAEGNPYTDATETVDCFASLLEANPARRAVERGEDLREVLMRPVDTDAIEARIRRIEGERREVRDRLDEIDRERDQLPRLETRRAELQEELADIDDELDAVRSTVDEYDADPDTAEAAQEAIDELEETRHRLRSVRDDIDTQETSIEALREERAELEAELAELTTQDAELERIEQELARLQERERAYDDAVGDLSAIVEFTGDLLDDGCPDLPGAEPTDDVTAELDPDAKTVECWTCGSEVTTSDIRDRLCEFETLVSEKRSERAETRDRLEELRDRRDDLRSVTDRQERLESRLRDVDAELDRREGRIEELEADAEDVREEVSMLEAHIEETEELRESDLLDRYQRLSELEYERGRLERELSDVETSIETLDALADERDQLDAQDDELAAELESLRTRIDDLERASIESFNEHVADVLELLGYENLERVWIERTEKERREGRQNVSQSTFELHVVRTTDDGAVYEDTVDTLSESERDVVGLMVALAGYLVHDVYETVPMMLLDSLEAIDSERIGALIEYIAEYAPYLVVALLPEDAEALDEEYEHVPADALAA
ncbi:chromosome segregation protein SMC [Halobacteriales archaeon QS_1_69_70]|nr:MAG: chromosome segregation protein SMC [Halobacteriales archaeon QS_1_69_70]